MIGAERLQRADPLRHHAGDDGLVDIGEAEARFCARSWPSQTAYSSLVRLASVMARHWPSGASFPVTAVLRRRRTRCWCCRRQPRAACAASASASPKKTSPAEIVSGPPGRASTSAPSSSSPSNTPTSRFSPLVTVTGPPSPWARASQALRTAAKPRVSHSAAPVERRQQRGQRVFRRKRRGAGVDEARRRDRAPRSPGWLARFTPMPSTTQSTRPPGFERRFQQHPGDLAAVHEDIVRPLAARPAGQRPVHQVEHRERRDEGELRDRSALRRRGGGSPRGRDCRAARPRRAPRLPRPARCCRAQTTVPSGAPASARALASSLVLPASSRAISA